MKNKIKTNAILIFMVYSCLTAVLNVLPQEPYYDDGETQLTYELYEEEPNRDRIASLLEKGASPDLPNKTGFTPLEIAVSRNYLDIVSLLLKAGANINRKDFRGDTPLLKAKTKKMFDFLVEKGAHVNALNNLTREGLLTVIRGGDKDLVVEFLKHYKINQKNPEDQALLFKIIHSSNLNSLITPLVKVGVSLETQDVEGNTILHEAVINDNPEAVLILLLLGAPLYKFNNLKETPLLVALNYHQPNQSWKSAQALLNAEIKALSALTGDELKNKKLYAQQIFAQLSALQQHVGLNDENFRKDIERALGVLSRKFGLTSEYKLGSLQKSDLVSINDVSVVDTSSIKDASSFLASIARPLTRPLTQTQAYLSVPSLRENVVEVYKKYIQQYPKLIKRIIEQEEKLKDYDVFYHGQERDFIVFYDAIKEIQNWFNSNSGEFEYIRLPQRDYNKKLSEFITLGEVMYHRESALNKYLLSVNFSLFGNTGEMGEGTFSFFVLSRNEEPPKNLLTRIFKNIGINTSYVKEVLDLLPLIESPTGNLLQIFIPIDKVNEYVYVSGTYGVPLANKNPNYGWRAGPPLFPVKVDTGNSVPPGVYDLRTIDAKTYLGLYRNYFDQFDPKDINLIQGRINITQDFLLNPKSGVKIFRYNTVHPDKMREYKQKLREIMTRAMKEWEEAHKGVSPQKTITQLIAEVEKTIGSQTASTQGALSPLISQW